ncbi:MAG: zinc-dependent peptidase [Bacteroidia bacterium]
MFTTLIVISLLFFVGAIILSKKPPSKPKSDEIEPLEKKYIDVLNAKISFYEQLSPEDKERFEHDVNVFLRTTKITGIQTAINHEDETLIAAGACIPVFNFPEWQYNNLNEVILYPNLFDENFATQGKGRFVSGMVGNGVMEGKMILSKRSLHLGFDNRTDKKNVAVHEFIHLIDKADGSIDGVPSLFVDKTFALPWFELMRQKIKEIEKNKSDINPYGATNPAEFFSVVSEYFFERPKLLKKKHPQLYDELTEIFDGKKRL